MAADPKAKKSLRDFPHYAPHLAQGTFKALAAARRLGQRVPKIRGRNPSSTDKSVLVRGKPLVLFLQDPLKTLEELTSAAFAPGDPPARGSWDMDASPEELLEGAIQELEAAAAELRSGFELGGGLRTAGKIGPGPEDAVTFEVVKAWNRLTAAIRELEDVKARLGKES